MVSPGRSFADAAEISDRHDDADDEETGRERDRALGRDRQRGGETAGQADQRERARTCEQIVARVLLGELALEADEQADRRGPDVPEPTPIVCESTLFDRSIGGCGHRDSAHSDGTHRGRRNRCGGPAHDGADAPTAARRLHARTVLARRARSGRRSAALRLLDDCVGRDDVELDRRRRPSPATARTALRTVGPRAVPPAGATVVVRVLEPSRIDRRVEWATGPIDVCHSTTVIPAATKRAPCGHRARRRVRAHAGPVHGPRRTGHDRRARAVPRVPTSSLVRARRRPTIWPSSGSIRTGSGSFRGVSSAIVPVDAGRARPPARTNSPTVRPVRRHDRAAQEPRRRSATVARLDERMPLVVAGCRRAGGTSRSEPTLTSGSSASCRRRSAGVCTRQRPCSPTPAWQEGFGMPILEAMAPARPSSRAPGRPPKRPPAGPPSSSIRTDVDSIAGGIRRRDPATRPAHRASAGGGPPS